jgi:hypothetical protein
MTDSDNLTAQIARWRRTGAWVCLADIVEWRATGSRDGIRRELHACEQVKAAILDNKTKIAGDGSLLIVGGKKAEPATDSDIQDIERSQQYRLPEGHDAMMYLLAQCWIRRDALIELANICGWRGMLEFLRQKIASAKKDGPPPIQGRLRWDIMRILEEPGAAACVNATDQIDYVRRRLNDEGHKKFEGDLKRSIQRAKKEMKAGNQDN